VVTLTRKAKRDLKTKIRPGVESSIKLNIQKQVEEQGLGVVSREVEIAAMNIFYKMNVGKASGMETTHILSGRSTLVSNTPVRPSIDSNGKFQPLNWKTIAQTYNNPEK